MDMVPKSHCPVAEGGPVPKLGGVVPITMVTMPTDGPKEWHGHQLMCRETRR